MRNDYDCQEFLDFCEKFDDDFITGLLEDIIFEPYARNENRKEYIDIYSNESQDREGANHVIKGTFRHNAKRWEFKIENGNWNGTVVTSFEQIDLHAAWPIPSQTHWLFQRYTTVLTRIYMSDMRQAFLSMSTNFSQTRIFSLHPIAFKPMQIGIDLGNDRQTVEGSAIEEAIRKAFVGSPVSW